MDSSCPVFSVAQSERENSMHQGPAAGPCVKWCPLTPLPLYSFWISSGVNKSHSHKTWWLFGECFPQFKVHEIMWVFLCSLADWWVFSPKLMICLHTLMCGIRMCGILESAKTVGIVLEDCAMEKKLDMLYTCLYSFVSGLWPVVFLS